MKTSWPPVSLVAVAALALVATAHGAAASRVEAAFEAFWAARSTAEAAAHVDAIVESGVSFDEAYRRLRQGRHYPAQQSGTVRLTSRTPTGVEHRYGLTIPDTYDPSRKYPVRFHLHGGVMGRHDPEPPASAGGIGALAGDPDEIYIVPFAWDASPWWTTDQLLNLRETLDAVKRQYNVDENRVVVSGVSDGGTGAYYVAMRDTTPYASFLPLNGFWGVLANHDLRIDGPLYPDNLRDKPFFIVNGGHDPLYPPDAVEPAIAHFKRMGVTLDYRPQPFAGHNTQWWPQVKDAFDAFAREHPRNPLPDTLTWETTNTQAFNRAHWLIVNALGRTAGEPPLDDPNLVAPAPRLDFGVRSVLNRINLVRPGSNADRIGLKAGDALVRVNDQSVRVALDVEEVFASVAPGSPVTLLVARDNAPVELTGVYEPARVQDPPHALFDRDEPSGRVDLTRTGNTIDAKTRGVRAFTLLLSPDQFDFGRNVKVVVNGRVRYDGRVAKNLRTLVTWAAADNDRTMLFGAELRIAVE